MTIDELLDPAEHLFYPNSAAFRDQCAAAYLASGFFGTGWGSLTQEEREAIAVRCYQVADEMLKVGLTSRKDFAVLCEKHR
jgi:hypothetical protein